VILITSTLRLRSGYSSPTVIERSRNNIQSNILIHRALIKRVAFLVLKAKFAAVLNELF
jgi:hypothetical protein